MRLMNEKSLEENFIDWESHVFGYGYGTGEDFIIPAVKKFFDYCPKDGCYHHEILEKALGPAVAWLLINTFCHHQILEYGTSPRSGWLSATGKALQEFFDKRTEDELFEILDHDDRSFCDPSGCNCGGYSAENVCVNPFWKVKK